MTDNQPPYGQPSPQYQAPQYQAPTYPGVAQRAGGGGSGRPSTVTGAAVLTHIGAAFVIAVGVLLLVGLLISLASVDNLPTDSFSGMTVSEVRALLAGLGGGFVVFGIALIVLAVHAARGRGWARITLTVVGGLSIAVFARSVLSSGYWVVTGLLYQLAAVGLLWLGGANAWYRSQRAARRAANAAPPVPPGPPAPPIR